MSRSGSDRIVIIGAGPTGLGAATRLHQLGHKNWLLLEKAPHAGGLSASFKDSKGFTWDIGGHVLFSHYPYFDKLMLDLLPSDQWLEHQRESWIWIRDRFVPYPFQFNIRHLPHEEMKECVRGLVRVYKQQGGARPGNFSEWIDATFGEGLGRVFMRPYNFKVWAYPPEKLSYSWIGERVAVTDLERVLMNIFDGKDDISWGPNNTFRFPRHGGTGAIWEECARRLPQDQLRFGSEVVRIDANRHEVLLGNGEVYSYDHLLSTMPLPQLVTMAGLEEEFPRVSELRYSSTHIFGIGLKGRPRDELATKCWMYFPEENSPFYRVTLFSNYSPNNVPDSEQYWSLMAEISESPDKPVTKMPQLMDEVVQGMLNTRLIEDRNAIVDTWHIRIEHSYPTPTLDRDSTIYDALPRLAKLGIASRGRFGAWRYEVANMDHSLMQGAEWVHHVLFGSEETTLWHPGIVNDMSRPAAR